MVPASRRRARRNWRRSSAARSPSTAAQSDASVVRSRVVGRSSVGVDRGRAIGRPPRRRGDAANARRSILPFASRGSASRTTNADGTIARGKTLGQMATERRSGPRQGCGRRDVGDQPRRRRARARHDGGLPHARMRVQEDLDLFRSTRMPRIFTCRRGARDTRTPVRQTAAEIAGAIQPRPRLGGRRDRASRRRRRPCRIASR